MNLANTDVDIMPRKVALSYLTDPKCRTSSTFRKQLWAALDKPAFSFRTILRDSASGNDFYTERNPKHPMERLAQKCQSSHVGILQLSKWCRRAARRTRLLLARQAKAKTAADQNILADHALAQAQVCVLFQNEIQHRTEKRP